MLGGTRVAGSEIDGVGFEYIGSERNTFYTETLPLSLPVMDEVAALGSLIYTRLQGRAPGMGLTFDESMARALAAHLIAGERLDRAQLQRVLGGCDARHAHGVARLLCRIGLLEQRGDQFELTGMPVQAEVFMLRGSEWVAIAPGTSPALPAEGRLRIVVRSRLTLELRVFRVLHRLSGGTAVRSIEMRSLMRGRPAVIEVELGRVADYGVEQLLMHVSWATMNVGGGEDEELPPRAPDTLAERVEVERMELLGTAGRGWVREYLFPRLP